MSDDNVISPLVANIITARLTETFAMTDTVVEDLQRQLREREAELYLLREDVYQMLAGPWMPVPDYIHRALYPSQERIDARVAEDPAVEQ